MIDAVLIQEYRKREGECLGLIKRIIEIILSRDPKNEKSLEAKRLYEELKKFTNSLTDEMIQTATEESVMDRIIELEEDITHYRKLLAKRGIF